MKLRSEYVSVCVTRTFSLFYSFSLSWKCRSVLNIFIQDSLLLLWYLCYWLHEESTRNLFAIMLNLEFEEKEREREREINENWSSHPCLSCQNLLRWLFIQACVAGSCIREERAKAMFWVLVHSFIIIASSSFEKGSLQSLRQLQWFSSYSADGFWGVLEITPYESKNQEQVWDTCLPLKKEKSMLQNSMKPTGFREKRITKKYNEAYVSCLSLLLSILIQRDLCSKTFKL